MALMLKDRNLTSLVSSFIEERSVSVMGTTIRTDYMQFYNWIEKCPYCDVNDGRKIMIWILQQEQARSKRKMAMMLRSFYKWASSEGVGYITVDPVASFKMPRMQAQEEETVVIPNNKLPLVLAALERKNKSLTQWDKYARFMLQTGMRTGEVRALRIDDVVGDRICVRSSFSITHGHQATTKTKKIRWVPLNPISKAIIQSMEPEDGYLFPGNRRTQMSFFRSRIDKLFNSGVIKTRYRIYDLRHTAISMWLESGIPVTQAAAWAGNSAQVIWQHYAASTQDYSMPVL
jgi:integrase